MDKVIKAFENGYNLILKENGNSDTVKIVTKTLQDTHVSSTTIYNMKLFMREDSKKAHLIMDYTYRGDSSYKGLDAFHAQCFLELTRLLILTPNVQY